MNLQMLGYFFFKEKEKNDLGCLASTQCGGFTRAKQLKKNAGVLSITLSTMTL